MITSDSDSEFFVQHLRFSLPGNIVFCLLSGVSVLSVVSYISEELVSIFRVKWDLIFLSEMLVITVKDTRLRNSEDGFKSSLPCHEPLCQPTPCPVSNGRTTTESVAARS
jgi:hypothetical protein